MRIRRYASLGRTGVLNQVFRPSRPGTGQSIVAAKCASWMMRERRWYGRIREVVIRRHNVMKALQRPSRGSERQERLVHTGTRRARRDGFCPLSIARDWSWCGRDECLPARSGRGVAHASCRFAGGRDRRARRTARRRGESLHRAPLGCRSRKTNHDQWSKEQLAACGYPRSVEFRDSRWAAPARRHKSSQTVQAFPDSRRMSIAKIDLLEVRPARAR